MGRERELAPNAVIEPAEEARVNLYDALIIVLDYHRAQAREGEEVAFAAAR